MLCRLQGLWHLGLFPEQMPHWQWMLEKIAAAKAAGVERPRVLNLFGYTGAASLLAAAAGAEVVHVDASKKAIQWARENQAASKLDAAPIRWMLDDARKFTAREVRRGRDYHVLLVDPPKFGRGPKNETWDLFTDLPPLMDDCAALVADKHAAMVLTVYAIRASGLAFAELVAEKMAKAGGKMDVGELAIRSQDGQGDGANLALRAVVVQCVICAAIRPGTIRRHPHGRSRFRVCRTIASRRSARLKCARFGAKPGCSSPRGHRF